MTSSFARNLILFNAFFLLGLRFAPATVIGTGETVGYGSLFGQNIDFDSTLTLVSDGTNPSYDTGAGLVISNEFTNNLGTGANQVQWTGSGGFTGGGYVNIGGLSTPETLTWGQGGFVPNGSVLVLDGAVFQNGINLGTDESATRQIDIGGDFAMFGENITGSGNLILQGYGLQNLHLIEFGGTSATTTLIGPTGQLTLSNVDMVIGGTASASSFNLTNNSILQVEVLGMADFSLSGSSIWELFPEDGTNYVNQIVGNLSSTDPSSAILLGGSDTSATITVNSGYFAGQLVDGNYQVAGTGGSLVKVGPGILTLANDNTQGVSREGVLPGYSQGTTVKQGTLLCANTTGTATGTGPITVMSGAALGGPGIVAPTGSSSIAVQSGGIIDLRAYDPAHFPSMTSGIFQVHLNPANNTTFQAGASLGFILKGGGKSTKLAFTGLTANLKQVFFNDTKVVFRALPEAMPGTYTLITFDQGGAYYGRLAPGPGYTFIYKPKEILVQITAPQ